MEGGKRLHGACALVHGPNVEVSSRFQLRTDRWWAWRSSKAARTLLPTIPFLVTGPCLTAGVILTGISTGALVFVAGEGPRNSSGTRSSLVKNIPRTRAYGVTATGLSEGA